MNKEWSETNKEMQALIRKRDTFDMGINSLIDLRKCLIDRIMQIRNEITPRNFSAMPYMNADGYHSKTIAYSLWHIFRIEDIVAHTLIADDGQVFFEKDYRTRMNSPIITTGNELVKEQIGEFSKRLCIDELYNYLTDVYESTNGILRSLSFDDTKLGISDEKKQKLLALNVVSEAENAYWLIDYWCAKDIRGLIQMPFSRHWIMHIEAALRIMNKLSR